MKEQENFSQNDPIESDLQQSSSSERSKKRLPRHLIEYKKEADFNRSIFSALKNGENIVAGFLGPPHSGKTTAAEKFSLEAHGLIRRIYGEDAPDPSIVLTYESGETAAEKHMQLQEVPDYKIYQDGEVVSDPRSEFKPTEVGLSEKRNRAVGPVIEVASNIDLGLKVSEAFRTLHSDPTKRVIIFDGPGNGFIGHNYGADMVRFLIANRPHIQSSQTSIFFEYLLGDTAMYTIAPQERDKKVYRQDEGQESWWQGDYGGASARRIKELLFEEVVVRDKNTRQLRYGTYPERVVQEVLKYPRRFTKSIQSAIQKVEVNPNEFTQDLLDVEKFRITQELKEIIRTVPEEYRKLHLLFKFVPWDPNYN